LAIWQQEFKLPTRVRNNLGGVSISTEMSVAGDDGNLCGEGGSFIKSRACCKSSGRMQNNDGVQTGLHTLQMYYHLTRSMSSSLASVVLELEDLGPCNPQHSPMHPSIIHLKPTPL